MQAALFPLILIRRNELIITLPWGTRSILGKRCIKPSEHSHNSPGVALAEFLPASRSSAEDATSPFIPAFSSGEVTSALVKFISAARISTSGWQLWDPGGYSVEALVKSKVHSTAFWHSQLSPSSDLSGPARSCKHLLSQETESQCQRPHLRPLKCLCSHTCIFLMHLWRMVVSLCTQLFSKFVCNHQEALLYAWWILTKDKCSLYI